MIEVNFKDRVPTKPGRIVLTPVAGQANTYDMQRADAPTEEGTPLDKATFNSIVHSRLTGRYYALAVSREVSSSRSVTTDPIPSSGWLEADYQNFTNSGYILTSSFPNYPNLAPRAFDNSNTTYYAAESGSGETWIALDFGTRILVKKITVMWFSYDYDYFKVSFQGSNNGTTWTDIASTTGNRETLTDWAFPSNTTEYSMYRLKFTQGTENAMRLYEWSITDWTVNTYKNVFTTDGLPGKFTKGQRLIIETPATVNTIGVVSNAINGTLINTILQSAKRYELVYNGSSFDAKEV